MYAFLFITHGNLGESVVRTAEFIMNDTFADHYRLFSIDYSMLSDMNRIQEDLGRTVDEFVAKQRKVVLFVDIFGGSPANVAFTYSKREHVDIISGINLAMVIYAFEHYRDDRPVADLVAGVMQAGRDNIVSAKKLLESRERTHL